MGASSQRALEEQLAEERLRDAAPIMLEALQELEEFLDDRADADDGIPNDAMRHLMEVRAAIAKATGRRP
jgi:hypothetical protein